MIRWGIIGCGGIAVKMAETLHANEQCKLYAVAARDLGRAEAFAKAHGAEKAYGSYQELADDPQVDAVYVATIHPTHYEAVKMCLLAGKPVLCEKPLTMTKGQAEDLFRIAAEKGVLLMEAIWTRFLPAWQEVKRRVEAGDIGRLRTVWTDFTVKVDFNPDSRMYNMEKGGGALLDLGVYSLHMAMYLLGLEFTSLQAAGRLSPTGSDAFSAVTLAYPDGAVAIATCGMDCKGNMQARIMGENGYIIVPGFFCADQYIISIGDQPEQQVSLPYQHGFAYEVEEFLRLLAEGKTRSEIASPEATIRVMGAIEESLIKIGYRYL